MNTFPYRSLLVACSVNTARSPMVVGFLKEFFSKKEIDVKVNSGGIASNARDGMLISMDSKLAMSELGIELPEDSLSVNLKQHRHLIKDADLILVLTEDHKKEFLKYEESSNIPIYTLREFAGDSGDIDDPSMTGLEGFRIARDEIKSCLDKSLSRYFKT